MKQERIYTRRTISLLLTLNGHCQHEYAIEISFFLYKQKTGSNGRTNERTKRNERRRKNTERLVLTACLVNMTETFVQTISRKKNWHRLGVEYFYERLKRVRI